MLTTYSPYPVRSAGFPSCRLVRSRRCFNSPGWLLSLAHRHVRFAATLAAALVVFGSSPPTRRACQLRLGWTILTDSG